VAAQALQAMPVARGDRYGGGMGDPAAMEDPQSRMQGKIIVE